MDRVVTAIMAALAANLAGDVAENNKDAEAAEIYRLLKESLYQKYGAKSDLFVAVENLEKKPKSTGRRQVLKEEIALAEADRDPELLALCRQLINSIKPQPHHDGSLDVIPLQRPPQIDFFVGRESELNQLLEMLQPKYIVRVCGPSGIGKSALVTSAVWKLTAQDTAPQPFPDGIIYHSFYSQPRVDVALESIMKAFGSQPLPSPYEAAHRILTQKQALLVFEGIERADDLVGLLEIQGTCGMLITSCQDASFAARNLPLSAMPLSSAVTLLQNWGEQYAADEETARQICELVGGSPLSIRLVGHYLAAKKQTATDYLAWLARTPLADLSMEQRQTESVNLLLEHSQASMSETALKALAVVGTLAVAPFDQQLITGILKPKSHSGLLSTIKGIFKSETEKTAGDLSAAVRELNSYGLLWWVGRRYQVSHPLIHEYAQQISGGSKEFIRQAASFFTALAWKCSSRGLEGHAQLDADRPHFMRILSKCLEHQEWDAAHGLAAAVEDYLDQQGHFVDRIIANEAGLVAAWQLGRPSEGAWLGNLGDTYRTMGHAKWAIEHFKKALETARQNHDPYSEGNCLGNLGLAYRDLGQIDQAKSYLKQSQVIFDRVNSPSADLVRDWLTELEEWDV